MTEAVSANEMIEAIVRKRPRITIEIVNNIHAGHATNVHANGAWHLAPAASDIEPLLAFRPDERPHNNVTLGGYSNDPKLSQTKSISSASIWGPLGT